MYASSTEGNRTIEKPICSAIKLYHKYLTESTHKAISKFKIQNYFFRR
jgi:hypothetical protein